MNAKREAPCTAATGKGAKVELHTVEKDSRKAADSQDRLVWRLLIEWYFEDCAHERRKEETELIELFREVTGAIDGSPLAIGFLGYIQGFARGACVFNEEGGAAK